jgi:serine phosphatase RsbU (regulator of sigma subunit)
VFEHRRENAYELDEGMDVAVVLFERSGGRARFAGANLGMFLARERSVELIRGDRFGIGYRRTPGDYEFRDHTIELTPSTRLYLASDGIETQMGAVERRAYGREQMVNVLRSTLDQPMEEQKRALIENVTTFMGVAARRDDVCLVGVEPRIQ